MTVFAFYLFAISAITGGLAGLTKTLSLEWQDVFCRAVDISPDLPTEQAVDAILADPAFRVDAGGYETTARLTVGHIRSRNDASRVARK